MVARGRDRAALGTVLSLSSSRTSGSREQAEYRVGATALPPGQGPAPQEERELLEVRGMSVNSFTKWLFGIAYLVEYYHNSACEEASPSPVLMPVGRQSPAPTPLQSIAATPTKPLPKATENCR